MRPLSKRKSLYYGCKVRNRAAIFFDQVNTGIVNLIARFSGGKV